MNSSDSNKVEAHLEDLEQQMLRSCEEQDVEDLNGIIELVETKEQD